MSTGEEQNTQSKSKVKTFSLLGFKILELCFIVVCIGLIDDPANNNNNMRFLSARTIALSYATFGAFLIFNSVYILMKIFKDECSWRTSALMSLIGFILFLSCASLLLKDWSDAKNKGYWTPNVHRLDFICGTGSTALVTSVLFLCDLLLTLRFGIKGEID